MGALVGFTDTQFSHVLSLMALLVCLAPALPRLGPGRTRLPGWLEPHGIVGNRGVLSRGSAAATGRAGTFVTSVGSPVSCCSRSLHHVGARCRVASCGDRPVEMLMRDGVSSVAYGRLPAPSARDSRAAYATRAAISQTDSDRAGGRREHSSLSPGVFVSQPITHTMTDSLSQTGSI